MGTWNPGPGPTSGDDVFDALGGESASGGDGNDTLVGAIPANVLNGDNGNDHLFGYQGDDELYGGAGDDRLYGGLHDDILSGGDGYDIIQINSAFDDGVDTIDGGEGYDRIWILLFGGHTDPITFSLEGLGSSGVLPSGATYTGIEYFWLDAPNNNDTVTGSTLQDTINGYGGDDLLRGREGADFLDGGFGLDAIEGGDGDDQIVSHLTQGADEIDGGDGSDELIIGVYGAVAVNLSLAGAGTSGTTPNGTIYESIERTRLTGSTVSDAITGADIRDEIRGGEGADVLAGGGGDDRIYGLGTWLDSMGDGSDDISGGAGADTIYGDGGSDVLRGGDHADVLYGDGEAHGMQNYNPAGDELYGDAGADVLRGEIGDDFLDGGSGADQLIGGVGDDTYVVDTSADVLVELAGEGDDTVQSSVSLTLGAELENLVLIGAAVNGTGNSADNELTGNANANTLNGAAGNDRLDGGAGADTMYGGSGDDIYIVTAGDQTLEQKNRGFDLVVSAITWALGNHVDDLTLTGAAAINGTGNGIDNVIVGNSAANFIDGKAGDDLLAGGLGNDTYVIDDQDDVVLENADAGADRLLSYLSVTLMANVERLDLMGAANLNGAGNALANTVVGNAGNNVINGKEGADTLGGGAGRDAFVFDTALSAGNRDRIVDFNPVDDVMRLDDAVFAGMNVGVLAASAFVIGTAAADSSDRIIYNAATGALLFDVDGLGGAAAVQFATLSAGLALTNGDFVIV